MTRAAVCGGKYQTCVIRDDHSTVCWGANEGGQLGIGDPDYVDDYIGDGYDYADYQYGEAGFKSEMGDALIPIDFGTDDGTDDGTALTAKSLACGAYHVCAILSDDSIKCWGSSESGKLGQGHTDYIGDDDYEMGNDLDAVKLGTDGNGNKLTAKGVDCADYHTCAILSDDSVKCWGANEYGYLAKGTEVGDYIGDDHGEMGNNLAAIDLGTVDGTALTAKSVSCGASLTCILLSDDTIKCWGWEGYMGVGADADYALTGNDMPVVDFGTDSSGNNLTAKSISCGYAHSCAVLSDDTIKCWGGNEDGQLGQGHTDYIGDDDNEMGNYLAAVDLGTDGDGNSLTAKSVMAGYHYTCAVLSDDTMKCWGSDYEGILGEQTTFGGTGDYGRDDYIVGDEAGEMAALSIVPLGTGRTVRSMAKIVNAYYMCAVLDDDSRKCWGGDRGYGNLGNEEATFNDDYIGDGLERNATGYNVRTGVSEMGDNLAAVNLGTGRNLFNIYLCNTNEYVSSNACTACAAGTINAAGDDSSGSDTVCVSLPDFIEEIFPPGTIEEIFPPGTIEEIFPPGTIDEDESEGEPAATPVEEDMTEVLQDVEIETSAKTSSASCLDISIGVVFATVLAFATA